jgi:protein-disulfide isomerase
MTNKAIAVVVAALLVAGAAAWWYSSHPETAAEADASAAASAPPSAPPAPASAAPAPTAAEPVSSPPPSSAPSPPPQQRASASSRATASATEDPLQRCLGSRTAPIRIEVFSDYQCPACRQYYLETIQFVLQEYATTGKVCVVYYEFPLQQHKHAREAARYAQAAFRLSPAHWVRVNETLYTLQPQWSADGKIEPLIARVLPKPDMDKVRQSVSDPKINALIDHDIAQGRSRGVTGTPTTFLTVDGQTHRINGPVQYAIMKRSLDRLLEQR